MAGELSKLADELEGLDDEPTGQFHINPPKGSRTEVGPDATGKMRAVVISESDIEPEPRPVSEPPPSKLSPQAVAWLFVRKFPPWGAVIVALAGIAAYVFLKR
jgi:hypothetical protein